MVEMNRNYMRWLSLNKPSDASIATAAIGSAGFDGEFRRVIDIMGVIDPVVAHRATENFGRGLAGHEKAASVEEILHQKPTYIHHGHLNADFWQLGYYFDASMRLDLLKTVEGIWRRDELLERGHFLTRTAIPFDPEQRVGWVAHGLAFQYWPTPPRADARQLGMGEHGYYINTFNPAAGDAATGRLLSPRFELLGDNLVLRVGGGFDPERLVVALWVDGRRLFSETGLDSELLSRRKWPIAAHRGKLAWLEIRDEATGPGGHLLVDEIVQWEGTP
jgi:hypothetical protein